MTKLTNLLRRLRGPSIQEQERAYLEAATDRYDLEYRQRQIDRGLFRRDSRALPLHARSLG